MPTDGARSLGILALAHSDACCGIEDAIDVARRALVLVDNIRPIGDQPAGGDEEASVVHRGEYWALRLLAGSNGRIRVVHSHGRFAWYELMTTDVGAAKAFYAKVMGWDAWDVSVPGRAYTLFTAGKASAGGAMDLPEDARKTGTRPSWIGYVGVYDVDAAADRIERLGGAVQVPPPAGPGLSRFWVFAAPKAARLALLKWLKPGQEQPADLGAPGRVGWHELL